MKSPIITTGISIHPKLLARAKRQARSEDLSFSKFICRRLVEHFSKKRKARR
jgi:hypothetical protein